MSLMSFLGPRPTDEPCRSLHARVVLGVAFQFVPDGSISFEPLLVQPNTILHLSCHGKLERVQGTQSLPVAVSDDKTLRRRIVEIANRDERDCAACGVIEKSNTQGGGSFSVQMTRARFQRQGGMQLNASKAGDDDPPVRSPKQGRDLLGAEFWVVEFNERAGVEEVVHRFQNRSSRSAIIASDQELASIAVILRTSS